MQLNLPAFDARVRRLANGDTQIFDTLRSKFVALTPEEWVRQHFVHWLLCEKGYPASLTANEVGIRLNGTLRRCDTVVFGRDGLPAVIIEYKAPHVAISQQVFDQIARYNLVLGAGLLIVSNGIDHYCCRYDRSSGLYSFIRTIPSWQELSQPSE